MRLLLRPKRVKQQSLLLPLACPSASSNTLANGVTAIVTALLVLFTASLICCPAEGRRVHKRFIIHIPYKVKTHHHTHTVYSVIHSGATKHQTVYKILGYSKQGRIRNDYRDDIRPYEQGCSDHRGGMVFNHYSRNDDEERYYPGLEAVFEDDQRDEWEG